MQTKCQDNPGSRPGLSWGKRFAYALPALSLAVIGIPVYVFMPKFYTDIMQMNISVVGILLMAVRLFDAFTDPVIGFVSDKTNSMFGRRRPYIFLGAVGLAISILFLFRPPELSGTSLAAYFGIWLFALFFFWTLITIPYESLGPELTPDYHERTSLFALRDGFLILGTLLAAASPLLIEWGLKLSGNIPGEKEKFSIMAFIFAPLIVSSSIYCILKIKEKQTQKIQDSLFRGYSAVLKNRAFLILIAAYAISAFGSNLPATLILYYVEYVLKSQQAELFLLIYFLTGILLLPFWVKVSRKVGKKKAWIISMVINTGAFSGVFFLGPGDVVMYGVLVFLSGIGFGAGLALPSAIQADAIDYDQLLTGRRREGRYIGLWSIAKKLSAALGVGIGLMVLGQAGYRPNLEQGEQTILMIRILYAMVPCICNVLAIVIISFYPITEQQHNQIRKKIEHKAERRQPPFS